MKSNLLKSRSILSLLLAAILLFSTVSTVVACRDADSSALETTVAPQTAAPPSTTENPPITSTPEDFVDEPIPGLFAEYYNGISQNTFVTAEIADTVGGVYDNGTPPIEGVNPSHYSIVWRGRIKAPYTGTVTFTTAADDGVTVTVGESVVISDFGPHFTEYHSGSIEMVKDTLYDITVKYYNGELGGDLMLFWQYEDVDCEIPMEAFYQAKYPVRMSYSYTNTSETVTALMQTASDCVYTLVLEGLSKSGTVVNTVRVPRKNGELVWEATMTVNDEIKSYRAFIENEEGNTVSTVETRAHKEDVHITVNTKNSLGKVSNLLYGACMEDVNHELYGGIWSQMIFGESFEEAPSSAKDSGFTAAGGSWSVISDSGIDVLTIANTANGPKLLVDNTATESGSFSADVYVDGEGAGFLVKTSNASAGADNFDGYEVSLFNNMVRVAKHMHNYTNIKDTAISAPLRTWVNLRVETTRNTLTVFVNGKKVYSYTDPSPIVTGEFGFRAWNASAKYKNVTVSLGTEGDRSVSFDGLKASGTVAGMWEATVTGNVGTTAVITSGVYSGKQSQRLSFIRGNGSVSINNMGLNRMGMNLESGKDYNGYFYAKSETPLTVYLAFENKEGTRRYCETTVTVSGEYQKYGFSLTPNTDDDMGRFVIELKSQGVLDVGYVFLEPGEWGLYKGLHVRRDVGELLEKQGISVLRFGGCMANAEGYLWKKMTGAPETREIYRGWWYEKSSFGFGIIEFLDLCEALGVEMIPDFSSYESAADMEDFVQFALGTDPNNKWVKLRQSMGREAPYHLKYIQIGNEDKIDNAFALRFNRIANAIWKVDPSITVIVGDFEYKDVITDPMNFTGAASGITSLAGHKTILNNATTKGGKVLFDIHFWSESGTDPMRFFPVAKSLYEALKSIAPDADTALCVLELNANNHDFERALCNAMAISNAERISDIITIMCSANALQVDKQNDNGWNQGLVFMDNSGAWYQAPAYVDRMFYDCYLDNLASFTASDNVNDLTFDVTAMVSDDGKTVSLKIVNRTGDAKGLGIEIPDFENVTMKVVAMKGVLKAKNTTEKKDMITPDKAVITEDALASGMALINVSGYSVTTVVFTAN